MDAFVLKRSSRVMPGLRGTPALCNGRGDGVDGVTIGSRRRAGATEVKKRTPNYAPAGMTTTSAPFSASSALPTPVTPVTVAGVLQWLRSAATPGVFTTS